MVILRLRIKSADEWRELAPGDAVGEPIFVPTTRAPAQSGQTVHRRDLVESCCQNIRS